MMNAEQAKIANGGTTSHDTKRLFNDLIVCEVNEAEQLNA
jgi:hypothetical protein